jgi:hypothetical protein
MMERERRKRGNRESLWLHFYYVELYKKKMFYPASIYNEAMSG